jgi:NAD(P)-dependent dehydrogenase (short-subunit alcohol dehydrogenase family)
LKLQHKIVIVTGGAHGIGRAMAERFAREGAKVVVIADRDEAAAKVVASSLAGLTEGVVAHLDVRDEEATRSLVESTMARFGPIDLFCANAGIAGPAGGEEIPNEAWREIWEVNVQSHVYAARAVLPGMLARGEGYLLTTASAAGLLTQIGSAPYSVTKHAAVAFAEWLSITYAEQGVRVSCLCPQGVRTRMLTEAAAAGAGAFLLDAAIETSAVADAVIEGLAAERFLILPHPEVATYYQHKAGDYERWLRGMRRLRESVAPPTPPEITT